MANRLDTAKTDLEVVKEYLQIGHDDSDTTLAIMIDAAFGFVQEHTALLFNDTPQAERTDYCAGGQYDLWAPYGLLSEVSEVYDTVGLVVISASDYVVLLRRRIRHTGESRWDEGHDRFKVTYTAGYTAATFPASLKLGVLGMCERAYRSPGGRKWEKGAGHSWEWQELVDSDVLAVLDRYSLRGFVG